MDKVSFSEGGNIGGIRSLYLTLFFYLANANPVTFKTGRDWTEMEFLPESANCDHSVAKVDNGTEYSYKLTFGFNKQSEAMYRAFEQYIGSNGICQFTDQNGLTLVLGNTSNRVTLSTKGGTGAEPKDPNYYNITISWLSYKPALVV